MLPYQVSAYTAVVFCCMIFNRFRWGRMHNCFQLLRVVVAKLFGNKKTTDYPRE